MLRINESIISFKITPHQETPQTRYLKIDAGLINDGLSYNTNQGISYHEWEALMYLETNCIQGETPYQYQKNGQTILLQQGQYLTTLKSLARVFNWTIEKVRYMLKKWAKNGIIEYRSITNYVNYKIGSLITCLRKIEYAKKLNQHFENQGKNNQIYNTRFSSLQADKKELTPYKLHTTSNKQNNNSQVTSSTDRTKIKSYDIDFNKVVLSESEKIRIIELERIENEIKEATKKAKTLLKQKKAEFKKQMFVTRLTEKQKKINQILSKNELDKAYENLGANATDSTPLGKEEVISLSKEELKVIKVDQNNLIPAKYRQNYLKMEEEQRKKTIYLYKELDSQIKLVMPIEKQKLIRSIMKKYWEGLLNYELICKYTEVIREIRSRHFKQDRVIYDYWGLFNDKISNIGNKVGYKYICESWNT